jgi:hypothetical protein
VSNVTADHTIQVTYKIATAQTGYLQVSISPAGAVSAGAQWQVDGGAFQSSGATVAGVSTGSHTVAFKAVSGWTTPVSQVLTVTANQTATATGTYVIAQASRDMNGDGKADIILQNTNGAVFFWVMNGSGALVQGAGKYIYNGALPGWTAH